MKVIATIILVIGMAGANANVGKRPHFTCRQRALGPISVVSSPKTTGLTYGQGSDTIDSVDRLLLTNKGMARLYRRKNSRVIRELKYITKRSEGRC